MPLTFYMDVHVPWPITRALRATFELDILTAQDAGTEQFSDEEILTQANQLGRVVFTRDDDFLRLAHEWQSRQIEFPGVVYAHQIRVTDAECIRDLHLISKMAPDEIRSRAIFLPLPP